jgi:hypothetical protein
MTLAMTIMAEPVGVCGFGLAVLLGLSVFALSRLFGSLSWLYLFLIRL